MVERGAEHIKALCVVAAHLAERVWAVMHRRMPYVVCDTDGTPVTPAEAKKIIAEEWTVPAEVRARRRSTKKTKVGKAPQQVPNRDMTGSHAQGANETRRPSHADPPRPPRPRSSTAGLPEVTA
jgi:hypothetical protein